jgi:hypothetical protein
MRGYPMSAACKADLSGYFWQTAFDLGNVASFQFFLGNTDRERTMFIDNVHLAKIPPLKNIVDRYGQFTLAEWPGKIHADQDLISRHKAEEVALRKATAHADRDPWGGWAQGPQLKASGWFRTEKRDGRWWLVTPGGRLFWSVGLDCVGPDAAGPLKGQEELFSWRPDETDPLYAFGWKHGYPNFWGMNLYRTYGPDWEKQWLDLTTLERIAWPCTSQGQPSLPSAEVDESFRERAAYQEGYLTDEPDLSLYDELPRGDKLLQPDEPPQPDELPRGDEFPREENTTHPPESEEHHE